MLIAALAESERELAEARRREQATAEVINVISRSRVDLDALLTRLTDTARLLCGAANSALHMRDGDLFRIRAQAGCSLEFVAYQVGHPIDPATEGAERTHIGHAALVGEVVEIADVLEAPDQFRLGRAPELGNFRAIIGVPLLREGRVEGVFSLARPEPGRFPRGQVELVKTFADQAMIAIENARLFGEIQEALQRETATSEILRVISRSPTDAQPVFESIVSAAARSLRCDKAFVLLRDGDVYIHTAGATPQGPMDLLPDRVPIDPSANFPSRAILARETLHLPDWSRIELPEHERNIRAAFGVNSALYLPLLREGECMGVIAVVGARSNAFGEKEIAQAESFRDQAVIAIENARLFREVQAKTHDLEEALAQQTATADVLKVISRSAFDLQAVLHTLVESAAKLCDADRAIITREVDGTLYRAKSYGFSDEFMAEIRRIPIVPERGTVSGRVLLDGKAVQVEDVEADPEYALKEYAKTGEFRTCLGIPLLRNGTPIGVISLLRSETRAFNDKQIELVQTFADQAVIAIENARLFNEVQAKTHDLEESLERQRATTQILEVIASLPSDATPVFEAIAASTKAVLRGHSATVFLFKGDQVHLVAFTPTSAEADAPLLATFPAAIHEFPIFARVRESGVYQVTDTETAYDERLARLARARGYRSMLFAPLVHQGAAVGFIAVTRREAGAFASADVAQLRAFADQAVIAIENARLFDEVQAKTRDLEEALQQQTATADVLKLISRSAFDLQAVLTTLAESARELSGAATAAVFLRDGEVLRVRAESGCAPEFLEYLVTHPPRAGRETFTGRVLMTGEAAHIPDVLADPNYDYGVGPQVGNYRAGLGVPLMREGRVDGVFGLMRPEPGAFTPRQMEMVRSFADQAVIAIENARLFDEVQAKTRDLEEALAQQTATADVLKVISRSAFDLQAVLTTLAESARELCGASFVTLNLREGEVMRLRAESGCTPEIVAFLHAHPIRAGRETYTGRVMLSGEPVHLPDVLADPEYSFGEGPSIGNYRALLCVPLLREGRVEGVFALARPEPVAFTDRQIEIVRAFADQAVIAIQNARLFGEVQARTNELTSSLQNLRNAQDRLIQSEKLASLGQLTAGIAHEIKNPLNFVNNFSGLSREILDELKDVLAKAPLDAATRDEADDLVATVAANLDKVVQHGRRADLIVKNMLLHSREGSGERTETNVNAMVEEALNLAYHGARAEKPGFNVTIVRELDPDAGKADLYPQEITRVLLNLISNGFYATTKRRQAGSEPGYEPTLTASTRNLGDRVEIAIKDNGAGIPDNVKDKMFNPFFTTKPAGEGTGLGLSLSHDIVVKQHGGAIDVETAPGSTKFIIRLPRADPGADLKPGGIH